MTTLDSIEPQSLRDERKHPRYGVSVDEYVRFRRDGFLIVPGLVPPEDIAELRQHTDDLMQGRLPEQRGSTMSERDVSRDEPISVQGLEAPPEHLSPEEKAQYFLRIHMLHRKLPLHERYLLHPRILDVLEVLIGPDVMAMQSMLFLKPPGKPGQGWHQDSFYIPTNPDTLCGAWIAIDDADELNGGMWFAKGSGNEPVHPPCPTVNNGEIRYGFGDRLVEDVQWVKGVSNADDAQNDLAQAAGKYDQVLGKVRAGDVVFFNGHVIHRSKENVTADRYRRSFVGHFANARSFTQWGADRDAEGNPIKDPETGMSNGSHILARGDTHLPFAQPRFGTPCAALLSREQRSAHAQHAERVIANHNEGIMGCGISSIEELERDKAAHEAEEADAGGGY